MKALIVTKHNVKNFGAALQSYAFQTYLNKIGVDNELIWLNYSMINKKVQKKSAYFLIKCKVKNIIDKFSNLFTMKQRKAGQENFNLFFKNFHKTTKAYNSFTELKENSPEADVYISGSDQVFNPLLMSPAYFLQFGDDNVRRISYAASLGEKNISDEKKVLFKNYLESFDAVSLREELAKQTISEFFKGEISVNIDPAFLVSLENWRKIQNNEILKKIRKPYILVYVIYNPKWLSKKLIELKKKTGYDIVTVTYGGKQIIYSDKCIMSAGPLEFLSLIDNAELVVSSSFHGNVFATIYRKPFFSVINPKAPDRVSSLLKLFGFEDREIKSDTKIEDINFSIDYSDFNEILLKETKRSEEYLKKNIFGE